MRLIENKQSIFKWLSEELKNDIETIYDDGVRKFSVEEYDNQLKVVREFERNYETDFVFN